MERWRRDAPTECYAVTAGVAPMAGAPGEHAPDGRRRGLERRGLPRHPRRTTLDLRPLSDMSVVVAAFLSLLSRLALVSCHFPTGCIITLLNYVFLYIPCVRVVCVRFCPSCV